MDAPAILPPAPDNGKGWLLWIVGAVMLPALAGGVFLSGQAGPGMATVLGVIAFFVHFVGCSQIKGAGGCATFFLFVGGWALMLGTFFVGCLTFAPRF